MSQVLRDRNILASYLYKQGVSSRAFDEDNILTKAEIGNGNVKFSADVRQAFAN